MKDYGSYFAFDTFGESNVDFWLFVQAKDRLASFELRSELVNELHRRFSAEGIVISYPVRVLQFPSGASSQSDGRPSGPLATVRRRAPGGCARRGHRGWGWSGSAPVSKKIASYSLLVAGRLESHRLNQDLGTFRMTTDPAHPAIL